jgi:Flp pilus assembly pilin Flp
MRASVRNGLQRLFSRQDRGVAVVEYALFVGLLVLGTTAAIGSLEDDAEEYYDNVSNDIGDLPQNAIPVLTLPDGTPITTTTQTPTTSTTPSTTVPATTLPTTTLPTTTTAPPTTTTAAPVPQTIVTELLDLSTVKIDNTWRARVRITLEHSITGDRILGATVLGTFAGYNQKQCVTNSNGRCSLSQSVSDNDSTNLFSVDSIAASPSWDSSAASIVLINPE